MRAVKVTLSIFLVLFLATCSSIAPDLDHIQDFKVLKNSHGIVVVLKGTRHPTYTIFRLTDPLRLVIDIAYTDVSSLKRAYRVKDPSFKGIKVYQYGNKAANVARFEIYLNTMREYFPRVEGDTLIIFFPSSNLGHIAASDSESFLKLAQEGENVLEEGEGLFEEGVPSEETSPTKSHGSETAPSAVTKTESRATTATTVSKPVTSPTKVKKITEEVTAPTTKEEISEESAPPPPPVTAAAKAAPPPATTPVKKAVTAKKAVTEKAGIFEEETAPTLPPPPVTAATKAAPPPSTTPVKKAVTAKKAVTEKAGIFEEETAPTLPPPPVTAAAKAAPPPATTPVKKAVTAKKAVTEKAGIFEEETAPTLPPPAPPAPTKVAAKPASAVVQKQPAVIPELAKQKELEQKALAPSTTEEVEEEVTPPPPPPPVPTPVTKPAKPVVADKILDINVVRQEKATLIRIVGNGPIGNYNAFKLSNPARLVIDLWNVGNLFPTNQLYVDTPAIKELRLGQHPEKLRIVIEFKTPEVPEYTIDKKNDALEVNVTEAPPVAQITPGEERKKLEERALGKVTAPTVAPPVTPVAPPPVMPSPVLPKPAPKKVTPPSKVTPPPPPPVQPTVPIIPPVAKKKVVRKPAPAPVAPAKVQKIAPPPVVTAPLPGKALAKVRFAAPRKRYVGRRISLDFKDADIHNVLRLLAEVSNLNIIASSDVKGKVTVRMVNVPWDEALDVILQTLGLGYVRIGNVIRVAPRKELEEEEKERLEAIKKKKELEPLYVKIIPVSYGKASNISKQVKPLLSKRGSVSVDERTNVLIVKDIMRNIKEVETLVRNLDTQTPQVLIEARIVEASTNFTQELGIQWGGKIAFGAAYGTPTGLNFPGNGVMAGYNPTGRAATAMGGAGAGGGAAAAGVGQVGTLNSGYVVDLPAAIAAGAATSLGLVLGSINNSTVLDLRLSAIEDSGEGRIISSPRITTMDNQEATIQQGYSIPYESVSQRGTQTQFIDATLRLKVRPHVTADRNVILDLDITKDAPDTSITSRFGVPSISKKEAKTQILLKDGETAVIGGVFQVEKSKSTTGVPLLSKLPVIGWLFRRSRNEDKRTELLIFLTPRIIQRNIATNK